MFRLFLLACFTIAASGDQTSYTEHLLYKITPESEGHINALAEVSNQNKHEFVKEPTEIGIDVPVLVAPSLKDEFENILKKKGLKSVKVTPNVQSAVDGQRINKYLAGVLSSFTWDGYYGLQDIYAFFHDLTKKYEDVVTPLIIGKSVEGRNIEAIKISYGSATDKRIVFVECGIHAREWITHTLCTYVANELLTSKNNNTRAYAEEFEWIIVPVLNPDGYLWSMTKNRLWRKNRRPTNITGIYGVDLNRNCDDHWHTYGASSDPKDYNYAGPSANSEPEIKSYVQYLDNIANRLDLHLAFHSFDQLIFIPYGFTFDRPSNYDDYKAIGDKAAAALAVRYGTKYQVGESSEIYPRDSGSTQDYVASKLKVPLAYLYEMRPTNYEIGFLLPADQILPNNLEVWDSIIVMIREAKANNIRFGLLLLACITGFALGQQTSYTEYVLYKTTPESEDQIKVLEEVSNENEVHVAIATIKVGVDVPVIVAPSSQSQFENTLTQAGLTWEIATTRNERSAVDKQKINKYTDGDISSYTWDGYYGLDDIYAFLKDLAEEYDDVVTPVIIGQSAEGRNIEGIKISYGSAENKRIIYFECGIHAREWISHTVCTYVAKELLTSTNITTRAYAEEFEWILVPVTNPDGYVWSMTQNRLWRKSRRLLNTTGVNGVDLNRNFDVFWNSIASTSDPGSRNFPGPNANSEPEIKSYSQYLDSIAEKMDLHLAFHSYNQFLVTPYGYTYDKPSNYDDLKAIGDKAAAALAVRYGTTYIVGTSADLETRDSGSTQDYVKNKLNTSLVYYYELRSSDFEVGFLLPADQILPNNLEVWDSILVMIREAKNLGYLQITE